jgi:hypothetical protein
LHYGVSFFDFIHMNTVEKGETSIVQSRKKHQEHYTIEKISNVANNIFLYHPNADISGTIPISPPKTLHDIGRVIAQFFNSL